MVNRRDGWHDFGDVHQARVERVYNENGSVRVDVRRIDRPNAFEYGVYVGQEAPGFTRVPQVGWIGLVQLNEENQKVITSFVSGPEVIDSEAVDNRFRNVPVPEQQQFKQVEMAPGAVALQMDRGTGIVSRPPEGGEGYDDFSLVDTTFSTETVNVGGEYEREEEDMEVSMNETHDTDVTDTGLSEGHVLEIHSNNDLRLRVGGKLDIQEDVPQPMFEDSMTAGSHTGGNQIKLLTEEEYQNLLDLIERAGESGRADWDVMPEVLLEGSLETTLDEEVRGVLDKTPQDVRAISNPSNGQKAFHDGSGTGNSTGPAFFDGDAGAWISQRDDTEIS